MKIALIGAGAMGEALLSGILNSGVSGAHVMVAEIREARANELSETYAVTCSDAQTAVANADLILVVVKPQDVATVLKDISPVLSPTALVVSFAAGITTQSISAQLPAGQPIVRVMPNTPALVGQGMSGVSPGEHCSDEQLAQVIQLLNSVGQTVVIPEQLQDALTAVSGSGPAYVFYLMEAMTDAGVELGLEESIVRQLVTQTIFGAATLVKETNELPETLRNRVSSPNGVTVAAINTLDEHQVRQAMKAAMQAAVKRSIELGQ